MHVPLDIKGKCVWHDPWTPVTAWWADGTTSDHYLIHLNINHKDLRFLSQRYNT